LTAVKAVAEAARMAPSPSSEAVIAVKSPSPTPATAARARAAVTQRIGNDEQHGRAGKRDDGGAGKRESQPHFERHGGESCCPIEQRSTTPARSSSWTMHLDIARSANDFIRV
jgi:hypothetical protein